MTGLRFQFGRSAGHTFSGFVYDPADPSQRFVVELWLDDVSVRLARADSYSPVLAHEGIGDGCYAFAFAFAAEALANGTIIEARLANTQDSLGHSILLAPDDDVLEDSRGPGGAEWIGGLRFRGWVNCGPAETPVIRALIDGESVAEARATGFSHIGGIDDASLVKAFDIHLPHSFADGRVHRVSFVTEEEMRLASTLTFVAFADGVERFFSDFADIVSERLRGQMFERLLPGSVPFGNYEAWNARWLERPESENVRSVAVVLIASGDEDSSLRSLEDQNADGWIGAALSAYKGPGTFDPVELRDFLGAEGSDSDIFLFAQAGTLFAPHALQSIVEAFETLPSIEAVYADLDILSKDDQRWPLALPAFDYERMLEQGYCAHLFAMTRSAVEGALSAEPTSLYRLFNQLLDSGAPEAAGKIAHIPIALADLTMADNVARSSLLAHATRAHLSARGISAEVTPQFSNILPTVHVSRKRVPRSVTVIIPVRNRKALLETCLDSIRPALAAADARVLIVDNGSSDEDMVAYLKDLRRDGVQVLPIPGPFNYARINNIAVNTCKSDDILLLNNDIEAMDASWLTEMQTRLSDSGVGAVGATLLWPSDMIQHAGVVLGPGFAAHHIGNDRLSHDVGYGEMLRVARECSAVTAACLLTRRSDYLAAGGLDETRFPVNFNDVDYCLKLRSMGKRIVMTPRARLYHHESASRGRDLMGDKAARFERELRNLRNKWGEQVLDDPYYSPILSLDRVPFSALAWPPRDRTVRVNLPPHFIDVPPGF